MPHPAQSKSHKLLAMAASATTTTAVVMSQAKSDVARGKSVIHAPRAATKAVTTRRVETRVLSPATTKGANTHHVETSVLSLAMTKGETQVVKTAPQHRVHSLQAIRRWPAPCQC